MDTNSEHNNQLKGFGNLLKRQSSHEKVILSTKDKVNEAIFSFFTEDKKKLNRLEYKKGLYPDYIINKIKKIEASKLDIDEKIKIDDSNYPLIVNKSDNIENMISELEEILYSLNIALSSLRTSKSSETMDYFSKGSISSILSSASRVAFKKDLSNFQENYQSFLKNNSNILKDSGISNVSNDYDLFLDGFNPGFDIFSLSLISEYNEIEKEILNIKGIIDNELLKVNEILLENNNYILKKYFDNIKNFESEDSIKNDELMYFLFKNSTILNDEHIGKHYTYGINVQNYIIKITDALYDNGIDGFKSLIEKDIEFFSDPFSQERDLVILLNQLYSNILYFEKLWGKKLEN